MHCPLSIPYFISTILWPLSLRSCSHVRMQWGSGSCLPSVGGVGCGLSSWPQLRPHVRTSYERPLRIGEKLKRLTKRSRCLFTNKVKVFIVLQWPAPLLVSRKWLVCVKRKRRAQVTEDLGSLDRPNMHTKMLITLADLGSSPKGRSRFRGLIPRTRAFTLYEVDRPCGIWSLLRSKCEHGIKDRYALSKVIKRRTVE